MRSCLLSFYPVLFTVSTYYHADAAPVDNIAWPSRQHQLPEVDLAVLSSLYHATGGEYWTRKKRWMDVTYDPCSWSLVRCSHNRTSPSVTDLIHGNVTDLIHGNVTDLILEHNNLVGSLPTELGLMPSLQRVSLRNNPDLGGALPSELGQLSNLKFGVDVAGCQPPAWRPCRLGSITSSLPTELGLMPSLQRVSLRNNPDLGGALPSELGQLSNLNFGVDVANCRITSSLPTELGLLTAVKQGLTGTNNSITGEIPSQLGQMTAMSLGLSFAKNQLTGSIPSELAYATKISHGGIALNMNNLTGSIPTQLGKMTISPPSANHLGGLSVNINKLTGTIPTQLGGFSNIHTGLAFNENSITGTIPTELGLCSRIFFGVGAYSNLLTGPLPTQLGRLTNIRTELNFYSNSIDGSLPTELGHLTRFVSRFFLHSNRLKGHIPTQLGRLIRLRLMYTYTNSLSGSLPTEIGRISAMKELFLQTNNLASSIPTQVGLMAGHDRNRAVDDYEGESSDGLRYFNIDNNKLDSTIPATFCNLKKLKYFSAYKNLLSGHLPRCIFPELEFLNLARNSLSGKLPNLDGFRNITYLLLHKNKFTGSLKPLGADKMLDDDDIHHLNGKMKGLTLHSNRLDRRFPSNVVLPSSLNLFTISYNRIPGVVPKKLLSRLTGNSSILMSNNRLSCYLPYRHDESVTLELASGSLILVGNLFSKAIPKWVRSSERNAKFLSTVVHVGFNNKEFQFPMWMSILAQFGVVFLVTIASIFTLRKTSADGRAAPSLVAFMKRCNQLLAPFAAGALVLLLPVFNKGAYYFQCGDAMMKFSTIAYLADSNTFEYLSATMLVIYTFTLAIILGEFVPRSTLFSDGKRLTDTGIKDMDDLKRPLIATSEDLHQAQQEPEETAADDKQAEEKKGNALDSEIGEQEAFTPNIQPDDHDYEVEKNDAEPRETIDEHTSDQAFLRGPSRGRLGDDIRRAKFVTLLHCSFYGLVWILVLGGIGGAPTALYTMTFSLPNEKPHGHKYNNLPAFVNQTFLTYINEFFAFYNAVLSTFILPRFTSLIVRKILTALQRAEMHEIHKLRSILNILSRAVLDLVGPCIAVIYFNDGCWHQWRHYWHHCDLPSESSFGEFTYDYDEYVQVALERAHRTQVKGTFDQPFVKHLNEDICGTKYEKGTCARNVLYVLAPLLLKKIVYGLLFTAMDPLVLQLKEGVRRRFGWREISITTPDPMRHFDYLETALVFGGMVPFLLPLIVLQLFVHIRTFGYFLQKVPSSLVSLPVQWRAMQCHAVVILVLHSAMITWFFWDSELHGKVELTVAVSFILATFLVACSWRISFWNFLRLTWCEIHVRIRWKPRTNSGVEPGSGRRGTLRPAEPPAAEEVD